MCWLEDSFKFTAPCLPGQTVTVWEQSRSVTVTRRNRHTINTGSRRDEVTVEVATRSPGPALSLSTGTARLLDTSPSCAIDRTPSAPLQYITTAAAAAADTDRHVSDAEEVRRLVVISFLDNRDVPALDYASSCMVMTRLVKASQSACDMQTYREQTFPRIFARRPSWPVNVPPVPLSSKPT